MTKAAFEKIATGLEEAVQMERAQPVGWINEDELSQSYPYDQMFPFSKVDVVRIFPVYAPPHVYAAKYGDTISTLTDEIKRLESEVTKQIGLAEDQWAGWVKADVRARAAEARVRALEGALETAIDGWSDALEYKSQHVYSDDDAAIERARATLSAKAAGIK